jgi:arsenate reductase (glutaredoxin)
MQPSPLLYGIPNCDTVKRARALLLASGVAHSFHNFKTAGVPLPQLEHWLAAVGWQVLLNKQGTTWRKLDPTEQAAAEATAQSASGAKALMLAQPSVIRRPVVEWPGGEVTVGFEAMQQALARRPAGY